MIRSVRVWLFILLVGAAAVLYAGDSRGGKAEVYFVPQYVKGEHLKYADGASVDIKDRTGFGIGVGYNFNENFAMDVFFSSTDSNYLVKAKQSDNTYKQFTSNLYTSAMTLEGTYNFLEDAFTPYVSANAGLMFLDSGIQVDDTPGVCYWDPWWGYICYANTYTANKFTYGGTLGLRYDLKSALFFKAGVGMQYVDFSADNNPFFTTFSFTVGGTF